MFDYELDNKYYMGDAECNESGPETDFDDNDELEEDDDSFEDEDFEDEDEY